LARRFAVLLTDGGEHTTVGKVRLIERCVADDADVMRAAEGQHTVFDRALAQVVEHLVARDFPWAGYAHRLFQLALVEVADAVAFDLAGADQLLERSDRVL